MQRMFAIVDTFVSGLCDVSRGFSTCSYFKKDVEGSVVMLLHKPLTGNHQSVICFCDLIFFSF